ncbi:hypothetical protein QW131_30960 [Roseibium salinum]|nr:hypothetical protein [Roseibium salinum]
MSELETMNAQLSSPARVGGFALAYLQAAPVATNLDEDRRQTIEDWLSERMEESAQWFDSSDAPPKSQPQQFACVGRVGGSGSVGNHGRRGASHLGSRHGSSRCLSG